MRTVSSLTLATLALLAAPLARGATHCVGDVAELRSALSSVSAQTSGSHQVRIRQGLYLLGNDTGLTLRLRGSANLVVSGGWSGASGQCVVRNGSAATTFLHGGDTVRVIDVDALDGSSGFLTISDLSLVQGRFPGDGGCLTARVSGGSTAEIDLDRLAIRGCAALEGGGFTLFASATGSIRLRNTLVADNEGGMVPAGYVNSAGSVFLANNTFVGNVFGHGGPQGVVNLGGPGEKHVENNVFWDNHAVALYDDVHVLGAGPVTLRHNRWKYGAAGANLTQSNNTVGDPGFVSASDFRPRDASPLIDAGDDLVAAGLGEQDLRGLARRQGGSVDIGAYESDALLSDGFE